MNKHELLGSLQGQLHAFAAGQVCCVRCSDAANLLRGQAPYLPSQARPMHPNLDKPHTCHRGSHADSRNSWLPRRTRVVASGITHRAPVTGPRPSPTPGALQPAPRRNRARSHACPHTTQRPQTLTATARAHTTQRPAAPMPAPAARNRASVLRPGAAAVHGAVPILPLL
eukprot:238247-Chlamydomonas_euryale.AAC.2